MTTVAFDPDRMKNERMDTSTDDDEDEEEKEIEGDDNLDRIERFSASRRKTCLLS